MTKLMPIVKLLFDSSQSKRHRSLLQLIPDAVLAYSSQFPSRNSSIAPNAAKRKIRNANIHERHAFWQKLVVKNLSRWNILDMIHQQLIATQWQVDRIILGGGLPKCGGASKATIGAPLWLPVTTSKVYNRHSCIPYCVLCFRGHQLHICLIDLSPKFYQEFTNLIGDGLSLTGLERFCILLLSSLDRAATSKLAFTQQVNILPWKIL